MAQQTSIIESRVAAYSSVLEALKRDKCHNAEQSRMKEDHKDRLKKDCLKANEELMKLLLKLDGLVAGEEIRAHRKQQVARVQQAMKDLDRISLNVINMIN